MQSTAAQNKQMPNGMVVRHFFFGIKVNPESVAQPAA